MIQVTQDNTGAGKGARLWHTMAKVHGYGTPWQHTSRSHQTRLTRV